MPLDLEDHFSDIVGKAARGQGIKIAEPQFKEKEEVYRIARKLGLHPEALWESFSKSWRPHAPPLPQGLVMITMEFGEMLVNSYVVFDPATHEAAAFDSGADCSEMLSLSLPIRQIFLTHLHADHIFDVDRLREKTGATIRSSLREPLAGSMAFADGEIFSIGSLQVETRRTSGHAAGGTTFVIRGLEKPVAVVGDALFAGSMGGAPFAYREALETTRAAIFSLPDDTLLCPGHGPLTTVAEEKRHNPFFAT